MIPSAISPDLEVVYQAPGYGTGEAIYVTKTGRRVHGWVGHLPTGFHWSPTGRSWTNDGDNHPPSRVVVTEEPPKKRHKYVDPCPKPTPYRANMRAVRYAHRPEFHARSNPKRFRRRPWQNR